MYTVENTASICEIIAYRLLLHTYQIEELKTDFTTQMCPVFLIILSMHVCGVTFD